MKLNWHKTKLESDYYSWFADHKPTGLTFHICYSLGDNGKFSVELISYFTNQSEGELFSRVTESKLDILDFVAKELPLLRKEIVRETARKLERIAEDLKKIV